MSISIFWSVLKGTLKILLSRRKITESVQPRPRPRSVFIRHLDAGSSNDNEIEITALTNPLYDFEQYGFRLVTSPRHADVLLVSLPITRNMLEPARATLLAMPVPHCVISLGDNIEEDSVFDGSYAVVPLPPEFLQENYHHVSAHSGTKSFPPPASEILHVLLSATVSSPSVRHEPNPQRTSLPAAWSG
jgi:Ni,Fe-hydrogenase III small subunit